MRVNNTFLGFQLVHEHRAVATVELERPVSHLDRAVPEQYAVPELLRHLRRRTPCRRGGRAAVAGESGVERDSDRHRAREHRAAHGRRRSGHRGRLRAGRRGAGRDSGGRAGPRDLTDADRRRQHRDAHLGVLRHHRLHRLRQLEWRAGDLAGSLAAHAAAAGTLTYSLACTGAGGTGPTATVTLTVQAAAGHHGGGAHGPGHPRHARPLLLARAIWTWRPARARRNA